MLNYLQALLKADNQPQACDALDGLLKVLQSANGTFNTEAMRIKLAPCILSIVETHCIMTCEEFLLKLYITLKNAYEINHTYHYFLASLLLEIMLFHEARKELCMTREKVELSYQHWQAGERQSPEAQNYLLLLDKIEQLTQATHKIWLSHEANRLALIRLQSGVQIGYRIIKQRLNELILAGSINQKDSIKLFKTILGDESLTGDAWSLTRFGLELDKELKTVKYITKNKVNDWFHAFSWSVKANILDPLKYYEAEKTYADQLIKWLQSTLYQVMGSPYLNRRSPLNTAADAEHKSLKCLFKGNDNNIESRLNASHPFLPI